MAEAGRRGGARAGIDSSERGLTGGGATNPERGRCRDVDGTGGAMGECCVALMRVAPSLIPLAPPITLDRCTFCRSSPAYLACFASTARRSLRGACQAQLCPRDGRAGARRQGPAQLGGCSLPRVRAYVQQPRSPLLLPPRPRALPRDRRIKAQIGAPIAEHTHKRRFAARTHDTLIERSQSRWRWRRTCRATMLSPPIGQPQWTCHRKHSSHSCSGKLPSHPGPPSHMSPFQPGSHRLLCIRHRSIHDRGRYTLTVPFEARYYRMASYAAMRYAHSFDRALLASPRSTFAMHAARPSGFSCKA